jgi:anti-sigma factor RsiW
VIVSCRRFVEIITEAREGALPGWERRHFEEHATDCRACRGYREGLEHTIALLNELPEEPAPEKMREALLSRFRAAGAPPRGPGEGEGDE